MTGHPAVGAGRGVEQDCCTGEPPGAVPGAQIEPYPYDRLAPLRDAAGRHEGGCVDLSVGDPCDPPPPAAVEALAGSGAERSYPTSIGSPALRGAAAGWLARRFGVEVPPERIAACMGTKELIASLPRLLQLRAGAGERDTVLYPAVAYPTYAAGAKLAGLRAVPVPLRADWRLDLDAVDATDADRALCLWVNSPANPTGAIEDLAAAAAWGRERGVVVCSDECYVEFTWDRPNTPSESPILDGYTAPVLGHEGEPARTRAGQRQMPRHVPHGSDGETPPVSEAPPLEGHTILAHGSDGVLAVHSLSKRSNFAGMRAGFYTGDAELVDFCAQARRHLGFMVPGPVQAAAVAALDDDLHVEAQRGRYRRRLETLAGLLAHLDLEAPLPHGAFYLWVHAPGGDACALAERLATEAGILVSPGEFYGPAGANHVRLAATVPDDRLDLLADRLAQLGT